VKEQTVTIIALIAFIVAVSFAALYVLRVIESLGY
jgi:hypothetical protein